MSAVNFENVSFSYGKTPILEGLSFEIAPHRLTALLGPNGAGKSTIFGLMTGLIAPEKGRVFLSGQSLHSSSFLKANAFYEKIGVVFQQSSLDLELSVRQNLRYFMGLRGIRMSDDALYDALENFGLAPLFHKKTAKLSGGQRRRVEIVRALLPQPEILLLDEPTTGLDLSSKTQITEYVHGLTSSGVTVIWVTHMLDEIYDEDEVIIFEKGAIQAQASWQELGGQTRIAQKFFPAQRTAL